MLRSDVVDAVSAGRFRIYAVATVDEGIELLTGRPAGLRNEHNLYPEGTINFLVEQRLTEFVEGLRKFGSHEEESRRSSSGGSRN